MHVLTMPFSRSLFGCRRIALRRCGSLRTRSCPPDVLRRFFSSMPVGRFRCVAPVHVLCKREVIRVDILLRGRPGGRQHKAVQTKNQTGPELGNGTQSDLFHNYPPCLADEWQNVSACFLSKRYAFRHMLFTSSLRGQRRGARAWLTTQ